MKPLTEADVLGAITDRYLSTGKGATVAELAEYMGAGEGRIRRVLGEHGGTVKGVQVYDDFRDSHRRSYPQMTAGVHRVSLYAPTLYRLRTIILRERHPGTVVERALAEEVKS